MLLYVIVPLYSCSEAESIKENTITDTLSIATFNIQVFGQSKISKTDVMANVVTIIKNYDGVAIQEIRSKE
jgi:hypothetical protein